MPELDRRFEISIPFSIVEMKNGEPVPFFECTLIYHDMPYPHIVAVQKAMVELLERLNEFGVNTVEAMGFKDKLDAVLKTKAGDNKKDK